MTIHIYSAALREVIDHIDDISLGLLIFRAEPQSKRDAELYPLLSQIKHYFLSATNFSSIQRWAYNLCDNHNKPDATSRSYIPDRAISTELSVALRVALAFSFNNISICADTVSVRSLDNRQRVAAKHSAFSGTNTRWVFVVYDI